MRDHEARRWGEYPWFMGTASTDVQTFFRVTLPGSCYQDRTRVIFLDSSFLARTRIIMPELVLSRENSRYLATTRIT